MVIILIGAIAGIIYGLYLKLSIAITIIFLALLVYLIQKHKFRAFYFFIKKRKTILLILITTIISSIYAILVNQNYENLYKQIPKKIKTNAIITSEGQETEYYYAYQIKVENRRFILYVKKSWSQKLKYGMKIRLEGTYSKLQEARNHKGFSYKEYLKTKKICGSIKADNLQVINENSVNVILKCSNNIRNKIIKTIKQLFPIKISSLLTGILIGEKDEVPEEIRENFSNSSLSHILAISGTHVSYIIIGISFLLAKSRMSRKGIHIVTIILLILFMFITQFSPSVVRACIMSIIILFSKIVYRKPDVLNSIAISLILILANNPFAIKDIGLQLSYLGTIGIVFLNVPIFKFLSKYINKNIAKLLAVTLSAQLMVLPITVLNFNTVSTISIISNIIAVPLAGMIILIGYVNVFVGIISFKLGNFMAMFTYSFVQLLIWIAEYSAKIPFSSVIITTPSSITVIFCYVVIYCFYKGLHRKISLIPKMKQILNFFKLSRKNQKNQYLAKKRYISYILIIIILSGILVNPISQNFKIHFVDVGQRRLYCNYNTF